MSIVKKPTVGLMIRIKEAKKVTLDIKSQLRALKLNALYDAQFVNLTEDNIRKNFVSYFKNS
jgi:hypothetical protein